MKIWVLTALSALKFPTEMRPNRALISLACGGDLHRSNPVHLAPPLHLNFCRVDFSGTLRGEARHQSCRKIL